MASRSSVMGFSHEEKSDNHKAKLRPLESRGQHVTESLVNCFSSYWLYSPKD